VRALFIQFSALIGILTLANRLSGEAAVVDALLAGLGAATAMYIVLALGDLVVQRAFDYAAPAPVAAGTPPVESADPAPAAAEPPSALAA